MKGMRHIEMIATVARGLGNLKGEVVFVGGATVGLHITDPAAPEVRLSEDVDCVIEITTRSQYYKLEATLRELGFKEPAGDGHPLCRWVFAGIVVDIMPTDERILGFSNKWYHDGMVNAKTVRLPGGLEVSVFSVPYLVASKIEAFKGRGKGDYLGSADMEDIVALVDGCEKLTEEIKAAPANIKKYLKIEFRALLQIDRFVEAVRVHLESIDPTGNRFERAMAVLGSMAG